MSAQKNVHPTAELRIDEDRGRAELWDTINSRRTFIGFIGFAPETLRGQEVTLLQHTIVHPQYGRQGYARCLVTLLLDSLKDEGRLFASECTYIDAYLRRYPEYRSLQASA
jgi:predicted GNAT family acetyltransferase